MNNSRHPINGRCAGCSDCCVTLSLSVPRGDDRVSKPAGEPCHWLDYLPTGEIGCGIFGQRQRPWVCSHFKCAEILNQVGG